MNPLIEKYFNEIEICLIENPLIRSYDIIRREISPNDGKIRIQAFLNDGGYLELFEYVIERKGELEIAKYSIHWQDRAGQLIRRWDNAPHHPDLPNAPHHLHYADMTVEGVSPNPTFSKVFDTIERLSSFSEGSQFV